MAPSACSRKLNNAGTRCQEPSLDEENLPKTEGCRRIDIKSWMGRPRFHADLMADAIAKLIPMVMRAFPMEALSNPVLRPAPRPWPCEAARRLSPDARRGGQERLAPAWKAASACAPIPAQRQRLTLAEARGVSCKRSKRRSSLEGISHNVSSVGSQPSSGVEVRGWPTRPHPAAALAGSSCYPTLPDWHFDNPPGGHSSDPGFSSAIKRWFRTTAAAELSGA